MLQVLLLSGWSVLIHCDFRLIFNQDHMCVYNNIFSLLSINIVFFTKVLSRINMLSTTADKATIVNFPIEARHLVGMCIMLWSIQNGWLPTAKQLGTLSQWPSFER